MNKGFLKSIDLICSQCNLILKSIHIPIFLLLQSNLLHHLTDFVLNGTILWMVWRSRDDRKIARSNTVCHRVVYVPAGMVQANVGQKVTFLTTPSVHTLQLIGLSISKAYSSLLCNATRTFQLHPTAPSLDLYSFLTLEDTHPVST